MLKLPLQNRRALGSSFSVGFGAPFASRYRALLEHVYVLSQ